MTTSYSLAVISDRLQALTRRLDADPTLPGRLLIYSAPRPLAGQSPDTAVLLAQLAFPKPSLDNVTGSELTLRNPVTTLAAATGDAAWARLANGAGQFVADMDAGIDALTCEVLLIDANGDAATSATVYLGGNVSVTLAKHVEV